MSKKHAYWQLLWASLIALTLAVVGMGFYLSRHPEGPDSGVEEEEKIARTPAFMHYGVEGVSLQS